jgi:hypothetical protein
MAFSAGLERGKAWRQPQGQELTTDPYQHIQLSFIFYVPSSEPGHKGMNGIAVA